MNMAKRAVEEVNEREKRTSQRQGQRRTKEKPKEKKHWALYVNALGKALACLASALAGDWC